MQTFVNTAIINATLGTTEIDDTSTVTISMEDVFFIKEADKEVWNDGPLTYTITLANYSQTETLTGITVSDMIDIALTSLMEDTITFQPADAGEFTYDSTTGNLQLALEDIEPRNTVVISFRVSRVLP